VDYPIAANDDAIRSVRTIMATVGQAITQANAEFESKRARRPDTDPAPAPVTEGQPAVTPEAVAAPVTAPAPEAPVAAATV